MFSKDGEKFTLCPFSSKVQPKATKEKASTILLCSREAFLAEVRHGQAIFAVVVKGANKIMEIVPLKLHDLLSEFKNIMPKELPDDLPLLRDIQHQIVPNLFTTKLYKDESINMVVDVDKEIKEAMFDIGENRAPGPDRYTSAFFKHSWVGKLLVKYLGIPLLAKKLGINDCKQLMGKVKNRTQDWKNRFLSYARRLQLIASILATMQTYWASVLSKVAWKVICCHKKEDGLGLKQLVTLKGKCLWEIKEDRSDSGTWKALLELRNKIRTHIFHDIPDARINEDYSVTDMIEDDEWTWPDQWVENFTILRQFKVPLLNIDHEDDAKWRKRNGQMVEFSIRDVWRDMKFSQPSVSC
ncbi:hypothetical protein Tco_0748077 [Tanacetum coccineum]|uniref:Uncharacterized protein n=1 Tax=Tanacetum coccineum TaxID=301880 RepID=A0ABQ4YVR2_9ASTR